jgi:hypothetical protein
LAAVAAVLLSAMSVAAPRPDAFAVGILRRDGIIVPFARFDGKSWQHDWPLPQKTLTVPVTLGAVPPRWWGGMGPREQWQVWVNGTARDVHVTQPDWVQAHCFHQVGLRTDYRPNEWPPAPTTQPYPKDGVAFSPPQAIEQIASLPAGDLAAAPDFRAAFNRAEASALNDGPVFRRTLGRLGDDKTRDALPIDIESVYGTGNERAGRTVYVEAVRDYARADTGAVHECSITAFGAGWFARDGSDGPWRKLAYDVTMVGCDRYHASYMLPLALMRLGGRAFWLAQWSGWDHERYAVVELKVKEVEWLISAWGGEC